MKINVAPAFLRTSPTVRGWVLRMTSDSGPPCYWGGNPKPTPRDAVDSCADAIRQAFPTAEIRFLPASPAQIKRSIRYAK